MKKKKSIHDIAKEMKVSAATISYVISGRATEKRISKIMQQRILKYIEEIGFEPSPAAQSLRTGKTKTIGMLVEKITDPFFSTIISYVQKEAYEHGCRVFFSSTENKPAIAKSLIKDLRTCQVDGYIIAPTPGIEKDVKQLQDEGFPVILFDRYFPTLETDTIIVDNFEGAHSATDHLIKNGFSNIGLVTLESNQTQMSDRLAGYNNAMKESGFLGCVEMIGYNLLDNMICDKIKSFVQLNKKLEAILFTTNHLTLAGAKALKELCINIPDEIAIVGFDDNPYFSMFTPSITTVVQPMEEISKAILARLMESLADSTPNRKMKTMVLKTSLTIRKSSTNINKRKHQHLKLPEIAA